jgi:hypothetical protein
MGSGLGALWEQGDDVPVKGLLFGSADLSVEFHGFLNAEYYNFQSGSEHPVSSLDIHNLYLAAKARVGPNVSLFAEIEYEHGGELRVDRAFVDWELFSWLILRAGRFYVPLSFERTHYWAPVRLMTSRPLLVDLAFHEWADTGVEVRGRYDWIGYDVAVVNGPFALTEAGIPTSDVRAINAQKSVVGRLEFFPITGLNTGVAYAQGAYGTDPDLRFELLEIDARFHYQRIDVWAEYDRRWGNDEPCSFATDSACNPRYSGDPARKEGYYLLVAYDVVRELSLINYVRPILRFDSIRNIDSQNGARRITGGLNWSPMPHLVLKSEYQRTLEFGQSQVRNDGFMAALVADF